MLIDLHVHSTASDGTLSPSELVSMARATGISLLSLTDHDTTNGLKEFEQACLASGVAGLYGIELSAEYYCSVHILGYGIDHEDSSFQKTLATIRRYRDERNAAICGKLRSLGLEIALEEVQAESKGKVIARPHIAKALLKKGYVSSLKEAFDKYLGKGAPAYVPRKTLMPEDCITLIRKAKGLPVFAHPGAVCLDTESFELLLRQLKDLGLWGLECYSSHHRADEIFNFLRMSAKFKLKPTAGSDFHGSIRPEVKMGIDVPDDIIPDELFSLAIIRTTTPAETNGEKSYLRGE